MIPSPHGRGAGGEVGVEWGLFFNPQNHDELRITHLAKHCDSRYKTRRFGPIRGRFTKPPREGLCQKSNGVWDLWPV